MYCTRVDVERIYGKTNIRMWADLDNNEDSAEIEDRINYNIEQATADVDGDLDQSPYGTPFEEPYNPKVIYLAALKTGVLLYNGRRVATDESENQVSAQEQMYKDLVARINADVFALKGVERKSTKPIKVYDNETTEQTAIQAPFQYRECY